MEENNPSDNSASNTSNPNANSIAASVNESQSQPTDIASQGGGIFNGNINKISKELDKNKKEDDKAAADASSNAAANSQANESKTAEDDKESRKLGFKETFFLAFGGQAPFISLLTFGTVMISMVGVAGAFAMIIATFVVLANGLVVYVMSSKFKRGGGYYIYAFYSLTSKLGFETGWSYFLYSLAYGGALLVGGAYVLFTFTGINQTLLALVVAVIASAFVLKGIKISAKYAMVMSIIEITAIIVLSIFFLGTSHWHFYDPISFPALLFTAVIFGLGIPTGYGSIAPLSSDIKDSTRTIGKASVSVLLVGGFIAAFFFYSLGAISFTGNVIELMAVKFGIIGAILIGFIALNDGTLGGMAYMIANSRTFSAMSSDKKFPTIFSININDKPILSEIFIVLVFIIVIVSVTKFIGLYAAFIALGALAGLTNLVVHISAGISLVRISIKKLHKRIMEFGVGFLASFISFIVLIFSLPGIDKYTVYLFFGWIILGFLYSEALDMANDVTDENQ